MFKVIFSTWALFSQCLSYRQLQILIKYSRKWLNHLYFKLMQLCDTQMLEKTYRRPSYQKLTLGLKRPEAGPGLLNETMQIAPSYFLLGAAVTFYSGNAFKPIWSHRFFPLHPIPSLPPFLIPHPNILLMDKNYDCAGRGEISYLY